jgi:hypothetical protein
VLIILKLLELLLQDLECKIVKTLFVWEVVLKVVQTIVALVQNLPTVLTLKQNFFIFKCFFLVIATAMSPQRPTPESDNLAQNVGLWGDIAVATDKKKTLEDKKKNF